MGRCRICGGEDVPLQYVTYGTRIIDVCAKCCASIGITKAGLTRPNNCLKRKRALQ